MTPNDDQFSRLSPFEIWQRIHAVEKDVVKLYERLEQQAIALDNKAVEYKEHLERLNHDQQKRFERDIEFVHVSTHQSLCDKMDAALKHLDEKILSTTTTLEERIDERGKSWMALLSVMVAIVAIIVAVVLGIRA